VPPLDSLVSRFLEQWANSSLLTDQVGTLFECLFYWMIPPVRHEGAVICVLSRDRKSFGLRHHLFLAHRECLGNHQFLSPKKCVRS
jgi:hypothetical protein